MLKIAIIGFGNAGFQALKAIRERDKEAEIHVYSDNEYPPANPMLTTYYVKESIPFTAMFPHGSMEHIGKENRAHFHMKKPVYRIEGDTRTLIFEDGSRECFDRILIATGAAPFVPSPAWKKMEQVMVMRTPEDAMRLKSRLDAGGVRSILVVGASMIGIKIAELAGMRGIACTMVDGAPYMFPLAAFRSTADRIQEFLINKGTGLAFSALLSDICEEPDGTVAAVMKDGRRFTADLVLVCIGTRANTGCVKDSGIAVNKGIVIDRDMRTSCEGIYAAGDCAEGYELQSGERRVIGLWANAGYQGRTAGINMTGGSSTFDFTLLCNISHFMGMDFIGLGDASRYREDDEVYEYEASGLYLKASKKGSDIHCINMLGGGEVCGIIKNYFMKLLTGCRTGLETENFGILQGAGVPKEFISFLGGGYSCIQRKSC